MFPLFLFDRRFYNISLSITMSRRTLNITFLADEWTSSKGGLSAMDRELAIQLAKNPDVSVNFFLPKCSYEDKRVAASHNIVIVEAEERPGYEPIEWLAFLPKDLVVDIVIGHGVVLGKQAQVIRYYRDCKWVQVVHTAPDELAMHKTCSGAISKGDQKQWVEIKLCQIADLVVAVGPKLMEFYSAFLSSCGKKVYNFTPGIFADFSPLKFPFQSGKKFRLLVLGRGDPEDFELKGYDIVSQAVAKLNDKSFHLTFVGASSESETQLANDLIKQGLCRSQLIVKGNLKNREDLRTMLCASNLVIMPSRTEGFGLTALEALSAGVPFLVSQNSGFGEALQEVPFGSYCVVDSEDPEAWAEAIKGVRQKGSEKVLQECGELRTHYAKKYSWETQCDDLVRVIMTLLSGKCDEHISPFLVKSVQILYFVQ